MTPPCKGGSLSDVTIWQVNRGVGADAPPPRVPDEWRAQTLTPAHARTHAAVAFNVQRMAERHGSTRVGFITLTFPDPPPTIQAAQAQFRKFRRNYLDKQSPAWVAVWERAPRTQRLHLHIIACLSWDLAEGWSWSQWQRKRDGLPHRAVTSNPRTLAEFAAWNTAAARAGFGAMGPIPIRTCPAAVARYVAGYVTKTVAQRLPADLSAKLVLYGGWARASTVRTAWASPGAKQWRARVAAWASVLWPDMPADLDQFATVLGPKWALSVADQIRLSDIPHRSRRKYLLTVAGTLYVPPVLPPSE